MPAVTYRFLPEGGTLASGVREPTALADGGVASYVNLDPAASGLDVDYTPTVVPESASPAWTKSGTQSSSVAGGELTLDDASGADSVSYDRQEASVAETSPALLGMRMKWVSGNDGADFVASIADGARQGGFGLYSNRVVNGDAGLFLRGHGTGGSRVDFAIYHIYEWCKINNTRWDMYLDGALVFSAPYSEGSRALVGNDGFYFGMISNANTEKIIFTRVYYKISTLWPSTSPTADFNFDSGTNDTVWDMSAIKMVENLFGEAGNVKYKYGAGNALNPTLSGSFQTEAQLLSEADPTGRYLRIQAQLNGDGSQDAGWGGMEIAATTSAGGIAARSLVVQGIGTY